MAVKTYSVTKDFRYGTRMLRAGETVDLDGPKARFWSKVGTIAAPTRAKAAATSAAAPAQPRKRAAKKK